MKGHKKTGKGYEGRGMRNSKFEDSHKTRQWSPTSNKGGMSLAKTKGGKGSSGHQTY